MDSPIDAAVFDAQQGSKEAMEQVVVFAQGYVYNLALRMLQRPIDAEDATQEILIRIVTHLSQFRGESSFTTWMYRIASNTLLNVTARDPGRHTTVFAELSERLEMSLAHGDPGIEEAFVDAELTEEVRRSCVFAMLRCLDPLDRLTLILGEVVGVTSEEGAAVFEITPTAYRKRLSRARAQLVGFVSARCGIVNPESPCRCHRHVTNKIAHGSLDPDRLVYAHIPHTVTSAADSARAALPDSDVQTRAVALIRSHPDYPSRLDGYACYAQLFDPMDSDS